MATLALRIYGGLADFAAPLLARRITAKLTSQGIPPQRAAERLGHATLPRPPGPLIWVHAASVGESLSALPLIDRLLSERPDLEVVITTGTAASARILAQRLPARTRHQFAPIDSKRALNAFLSHWKPDLLVLVESELWPQMIRLAAAHSIPLALVNARLSAGSLRNWGRFRTTAKHLLSRFRLITTQTETTTEGLRSLGAPQVMTGGNLKSAAPPLTDAPVLRQQITAALNGRPVWLAASTHPGEDEHLLAAHRTLRQTWPDLCLILAPRHPERADKLAALIDASTLEKTRRSAGQHPEKAVFLADTLGEMGVWLRLAPVTFMGGSLTPNGGHNPWEGAALGTALLTGPHVENCRDDWAALISARGALSCTADSLVAALTTLLNDPQATAANALKTHGEQTNSLSRTTAALLALLPAKGLP